MKKIITVVLCLLSSLSLAACSDDTKESVNSATNSSEVSSDREESTHSSDDESLDNTYLIPVTETLPLPERVKSFDPSEKYDFDSPVPEEGEEYVFHTEGQEPYSDPRQKHYRKLIEHKGDTSLWLDYVSGFRGEMYSGVFTVDRVGEEPSHVRFMGTERPKVVISDDEQDIWIIASHYEMKYCKDASISEVGHGELRLYVAQPNSSLAPQGDNVFTMFPDHCRDQPEPEKRSWKITDEGLFEIVKEEGKNDS